MKDKKRVLLQINVVANSGSTGRIAEEIGRMAQEEGWRSVIAYGRREHASQCETLRIGSGLDILRHGLESRLLDNHGLSSRDATRKLIKQVDTLAPDIIHLHNIHGYYLNYPLLFSYLASVNIPVVWTLHDCWPFTGHCAFFDEATCARWMTECHAPCPCNRDYPKSFLSDKSERNYRVKKKYFTSVHNLHLVPVSKWLGELTRQSFLGKFPVEVIHNGISLDVFSRHSDTSELLVRYGLKDKHFILGVASVWEKRKGLDDFFRLRDMLPLNEAIVIVGLSRQQIKKLPKGVIGIERTESQEELAGWYSAADAFVNPTYNDTLPTTNIEAIACGTPVVTYKTGGSPETIDENTGIVVEKGDVNGLVNAIEIIKKNGKDYYSHACRQRALKHFNKDERFADYIKLYNRILTEAAIHKKSCQPHWQD